ncbi:DUF2254 family protein [Erythrobacter sp.]|jgi:uncharacterized membrane protein|uniref:DUF2254 family protein n=1 Tax=Erythrobacter sp. TaxID=1042 RepID=UPI002EAA0D34|nr:DUF2254 family protein [Erythrobacter sp.]
MKQDEFVDQVGGRSGSSRQGLRGWIVHRVWSSYWLLPVLGVALAPLVALALLWLDRAFLTRFLITEELTIVASAETARDFAGVGAGVSAAFITLYFSITLIVLSMAAGNLGVRLIDRWLEKKLVRVSISGLAFTLVTSLFAMIATDADAPLERVPLTLIGFTLALLMVSVAMLAVALHDLGRTMFVDTSINRLARDAGKVDDRFIGKTVEEIPWAGTLEAQEAGYVEGNDIARLCRLLKDHPGRVRVCASPGRHVLRGQALILFKNEPSRDEGLHACVPIGPYRSNSEGAVFQIRLLVEIAARALSPAINDFYSAIACADALAEAIMDHRKTWIAEDEIAVLRDDERIEFLGQDFRDLFEDPLSAFRQAASQYPSVSIRMIGNYHRVAQILANEERSEPFIGLLAKLARELAHHAESVSSYECDKRDIREKMDDFDNWLRDNHHPLLDAA